MKVKEDGYRYELETAEGMPVIDIVFCRNVDKQFHDGITNEELINILVHRMVHMVKMKPTTENINALTHMRQAKEWVNKRSYGKLLKSKNRLPHDERRTDIHLPLKSGSVG